MLLFCCAHAAFHEPGAKPLVLGPSCVNKGAAVLTIEPCKNYAGVGPISVRETPLANIVSDSEGVATV